MKWFSEKLQEDYSHIEITLSIKTDKWLNSKKKLNIL